MKYFVSIVGSLIFHGRLKNIHRVTNLIHQISIYEESEPRVSKGDLYIYMSNELFKKQRNIEKSYKAIIEYLLNEK